MALFRRWALTLLLLAVACLSPRCLAEEKIRKWTDSTGTFEIQAKLLKHVNGSVQLLKSDGLVITVPETKLSEADRKYLQSRTTKNPFAGGTPAKKTAPASHAAKSSPPVTFKAGEIKVLAKGGKLVALNRNAAPPAIKPDAAAYRPSLKPFVVGLEKLDAYARTSQPILVDEKTPTFALSLHRVGNRSNPATFGRVYLAHHSAAKGDVVLDIDESLLLLDHHIASGHSLAAVGVGYPSERGGDLTLLKGLAEGKPQVVARWHVPEWDRRGSKPKIEFARILDGNRVVAHVKNSLYVWDLSTGSNSLQIERVLSGKMQLSGTGRYLALPTSGGCYLLDLTGGELLGKTPFPSSLTPEVRFSPDGKKLAMTASNIVSVWDLEQGKVFKQAVVENHCGALFGWVGDKYVLTQLAGLLDIERGVTLWSYQVPSNKQTFTAANGIVAVNQYGDSSIVCMPLPHPSVEAVAKKLTGDDKQLMAVMPGTEVSIQVETIDDLQVDEIRAMLKASAERAGWKVVDNAALQLIAKIERGEKKKLQFRHLGSSLLAAPEVVTIRPFSSSLMVRRDGATLWSRRTENHVPSFLRLERGQSVKKAVKKYEKPNPDYFKYIVLPPKILRPEIRKMIGRSMIRNGEWSDYFPR